MSARNLIASIGVVLTTALPTLSAQGTQSTSPVSSATRRALAAVDKPPQERMKLPDDGFATGAVAADTPQLIKPREKKFTEPRYTREAMREKIQGTVVVEAIIGTDGTVTKARVFESLDKVNGLDEEAVNAVKRWTFEPGSLSGKPVPVYARLELMFRLH